MRWQRLVWLYLLLPAYSWSLLSRSAACRIEVLDAVRIQFKPRIALFIVAQSGNHYRQTLLQLC